MGICDSHQLPTQTVSDLDCAEAALPLPANSRAAAAAPRNSRREAKRFFIGFLQLADATSASAVALSCQELCNRLPKRVNRAFRWKAYYKRSNGRPPALFHRLK